MKENYHDRVRARHLANIYTEFLHDYIDEVTQDDSQEVKQMAYQLFQEAINKHDKR